MANDDPTIPSAQLGDLPHGGDADARDLRTDALALLAIGRQLEELGRGLQGVADDLRRLANRREPPPPPPSLDLLDEP